MKYPEHDKLKALAGRNQAVGEFIEWLGENGMLICRHKREGEVTEGNDYMPIFKPTNDLIAEFFGIDQTALENEKQAMLDELRAA